MSYKVRTIPNFDKALKRLAKKYASLKWNILLCWIAWKKIQNKAPLLETTASKYGSLLLLRTKVKAGEPG